MTSVAWGPARLRTRTVLGLAVAVVVAFAAMVLVATPAEAACGDAVDVQVDQDSCGQVLSASGTGNASGDACGRSFWDSFSPVSCVTVSGTGAASNGGCEGASGDNQITLRCVAVSGTGSAANSGTTCGAAGAFSVGAGCVALSGAGDATNAGGDGSCGSPGVMSVAIGCVAASGTGSAANDAGDDSCGWAQEAASLGCVAVSGAGSASNTAGDNSCGYAEGKAAAVGCVEVDDQGPRGIGIGGGHGCVASAGSSCSFMGNAGGIPNGVASATSGSWAVTHQVGGVAVTDVSGTGPTLRPFLFADGVLYTLTVGAGGVGAVAAGSPT